MAQLSPTVTIKPSGSKPIPPLENGDHLTPAEFERRYDAMPGLKKAELIEGKVFVAPPVSFQEHSEPHGILVTLLGVYRSATAGVRFGADATIRLDLGNRPQPDGFLLIEPSSCGQAKIEDGYVAGGPELVAEIAASSASYDLFEKFSVYRANGVREYIVWRTLDSEIDYFILNDGEYVRHAHDADGVYHSAVFPGLWLDAAALLKGDFAAALARIQQGIASAEHAAFVTLLESKKSKNVG